MMLSRFADALTRAELNKALDARDEARSLCRRLLTKLKATRAQLATAQQSIRDRYEQIARLELLVAGLEEQCNEQMHQLAEERAEHQATGRKLLLAVERVDLLRAQLTQQQESQP